MTDYNTSFINPDAAAHFADHQPFQCVLNCGNQNIFNGHNGIRKHLRESCGKAQLKCENCNVRKERGSLKQKLHNCEVEELKMETLSRKIQ